jgi:hypothetical protein
MDDFELMVNGKVKQDKPKVKTKAGKKNKVSLKHGDVTQDTVIHLPTVVGYTCSWAGDQEYDGMHKVSRDFYCTESVKADQCEGDDGGIFGDTDMTVTATMPTYDSGAFRVTPDNT